MESSLKISVITCFLNVGPYLEECIESILKQTYTHWELLLIDDGSTDNSGLIAQDYAARYPGKIIYAYHEGKKNKGLSASRNLAISIASGTYLTFLDGDDIWLPEYLENQVRNVQNNPGVAMVAEATEYWIDWAYPEYGNVISPVGVAPNQTYHPPKLLTDLYPLKKGASPCVCAIMVRKEVVERLGGFESAFRGMYEDQVFLSKVYLNEPVYVAPTCYNRYRQRHDSLVGSAKKNRKAYMAVRKQYLDWLKAYMENNHHHDAKVWRLLDKAFNPYHRPVKHFFISTIPETILQSPQIAARKARSFYRRFFPLQRPAAK